MAVLPNVAFCDTLCHYCTLVEERQNPAMSSTFEQHCGQCGLLLPAGSTTCPRCGAPVSVPQPGGGAPPSEMFPSFQEQIDAAETIVRPRVDDDWNAQFSVPPASAGPAQAPVTPAASGNTGPTGPLQAVPAAPAAGEFQAGPSYIPSAPLPAMPQQAPAGPAVAAPPASGALPGGPMPAGPNWPGMPQPGAPTYPGQPSFMSQPGASGEFSQPGASGGFVPPGMAGPAWQGAPPGAYAPGYTGPMPGGPALPTPPAAGQLPTWFTGGAAVLVVVGLLLIGITGSDWGNSSLRVGIAALVVGVIVLGAFLYLRFNQGYRAQRTLNLAVISVLVLIVIGAAGIGLVGPLHTAQANSLESQAQAAKSAAESQQDFQKAISLLPTSDAQDLARIYNDWGEYLLQKQSYRIPTDLSQPATGGAAAKFEYVLQHYSQVSDEAARAHQDAATAYYDLAKQQESVGCGDSTQTAQVIGIFQYVIKTFSDTLEAQQSQTELKKPQNVTGIVVDFLKGNSPAANVQLYLSSNLQEVLGGTAFFSNDFSTTSDASGHFTFTNVAPSSDKKYLVSYFDPRPNVNQETFAVNARSGQPANVVQVLPLCASDAGTVEYDLPTG
jgi:hypothetical protein